VLIQNMSCNILHISDTYIRNVQSRIYGLHMNRTVQMGADTFIHKDVYFWETNSGLSTLLMDK